MRRIVISSSGLRSLSIAVGRNDRTSAERRQTPRRRARLPWLLCACLLAVTGKADDAETTAAAQQAMKRATRFMVDRVSVHGGYVWSYLPDLSRRWGELEARPAMIWVQSPGTVQMGHVFLDAYHATGDEMYYHAAAAAASALIEGQLACGGWHYLIDFAGEDDLREWYATIARHAWRLEEYRHYQPNATFDDSTTANATLYLLRFFLEHRDPRAKAALERAVDFILDAQLPSGGWPQRHPPIAAQDKAAGDYTRHITFNDNVTAGNIDVLLRCHQALRDARLLAAARRGMDVFLATQGSPPQAGWNLQHGADLKPAAARSYEPAALATHTTAANVRHLLEFHRLTGDAKYLARIPDALDWLDSVKLPAELAARVHATHPTFVALGSNQPLYLHRRGSNVANGAYFFDQSPERTVGHYSSFRVIDLAALRTDYAAARRLSSAEATAHSILLHPADRPVFPRYLGVDADTLADREASDPGSVDRIIRALDAEGRWLTPLRMTSHPYRALPPAEATPGDFGRTLVGDEWDTSPYPSTEHTPGLSTQVFIRHMSVLIRHVAARRGAASP